MKRLPRLHLGGNSRAGLINTRYLCQTSYPVEFFASPGSLFLQGDCLIDSLDWSHHFGAIFFNPRAAKTWMHFFSYNHFIARATSGVPLGNVFIISTIDPGLTFSSCARQKSFLSDRTALPLTPCGSRHSEQQSTLLFFNCSKDCFPPHFILFPFIGSYISGHFHFSFCFLFVF